VKVFISADIEGVAGITSWEEARKSSPGAYHPFQRQMNAEVAAACEGASAAGATEIVIKDAHAGANNLVASDMPRGVRLIRGWSGHPYGMVQGLDRGFDAALFVGYHARAGAGGNPLAHTMSSMKVHEIRLNGTPASEYRIHAGAAALSDVPVVFVSGDRTLCEEVEAFNPATRTFATKWGEGPSQESVHPADAADGIREGVAEALRGDLDAARIQAPGQTRLEITFKAHTHAYLASQYPGAKQLDPHTVCLESESYFEILRALIFIV
jgi:D-amino peptidase